VPYGQTNDSYRFISELMDVFFLWLVFTSNLNSQTTWLKVKLKLVIEFTLETLELFILTTSALRM